MFESIGILKSKDMRYAQLIIDKLVANGLAKTGQGVAIWIGIHAAFPSIDSPHGVWHHDDPLNRKETLSKILMDVPAAAPPQDGLASGTTPKSAWDTKLPFAWDVILAELLDVQSRRLQKNTKSSKRIKFMEFWEECVDSK